MDRLLEFATQHYYLVAAWIALLILLLWNESRKGGKSIQPGDATRLINKENAIVVDIRSQKEWSTGHITGALHIPFADLDRRVDELKAKEQPVIVVCNTGQTAGAAVRKLHAAGIANVFRLSGGMAEWRSQNMPVVNK